MKKLAPLFALLLAALALAACGGGSDTTGEESAPAPETTKEAEGEKEAEGGSAGSAAVDIEADPSGQLAFTSDSASAKAGKVTVNFTNTSPVPHDVRIESSGGEELGGTEVISESSESATVDLKPGEYTYFCSIPGHRQAGMEGTLTVK
ncbi:MAG TPA: plastocyanin/azurin family copper-binding protein [Solirubrobacterales bacterium]|nr:plastocyanin/azurin family copper-binding protein [Solirubrobacterales bacterium]